ncbi:MAG TPA: LuxR C-terminal-related transcriptional regulator, partial [Candidatus Binatia bacterium]|nr:LuxR C-terminal-related transcriptional regulator [Candidatus Binatia bacterium]
MQHHAHRELGRAALRELAQKAARWYEENRMLAEATEASLYAQDYALAATLIERIIAPRLVQNEFHTLRRWMAQLPEDVLRAHPAICMTFATAILFTSPRHLPETKRRLQLPLEISEAHWQQAHDEYRLGEVYAFHSLVDWLQGDFKDCFSRARQALNLLPDEDRQWRGISLIMLAVEALLNGKVHEARQAIEEALARCEAVQNIYGTLDSMLLLGEICYRQGALLQARQIFKKVLDRVENAPMSRDQASIRGIRATLGLGLLDLEGNNLEQAQNAVAGAVAASEQFPQEYMLADCPLVLIEVMVARDEHEQAQQRLESLLAQTGRRYLFRFPSPYRAHLAMARGDLATAERWAARDTPSEEDMWPLQRLQAGLVGARVKIAQDNAEAAIPQLKSWLEETQIERHTRGEIEISLVLARAYNAAGDSQQAQKMLIHALEMGRPANHRRIFLDLGAALAPLLKEAIPSIEDDALAAYARALFYTYSQEQAAKPENAGGAEWLVEPLTEQELRVLSLLAAGLSNPQIGEELVISVNTVKTHVKNIYGKLGVSNRREASDAAQQLNLL